MPTVDPGDTVCLAAQDLITALQNPNPNAPIDLQPRHNQALCDLSNIFQSSIKQTSEGEGKSLRVANEPSTSHDTPQLGGWCGQHHEFTSGRQDKIHPSYLQLRKCQIQNPYERGESKMLEWNVELQELVWGSMKKTPSRKPSRKISKTSRLRRRSRRKHLMERMKVAP